MGIWKRLRGIEDRQDGGAYSAAIIAMIQSQASGATASVGATAAMEASAGFVGRAFASADVTSSMTGVLDPQTLSMIGRSLIRHGEYLAVIRMGFEEATLRLSPVATWNVLGGENPASWVYRVQLAGPSEQRTLELPAEGVIHVRYSSDPATPWRGVGPLQAARLAGRLSAEVSKALADEFAGPRGHLLPLPTVGGDDPRVAALKADINNLGGQLAFVESQAGGYGTDSTAGSSSQSGWEPKRIGADIPAGSIETARLAFSETVAACGLSTALWGDSEGTGAREAYRQALHSVIAPLGRLASAELAAKLGSAVVLDWSELRAGDISASARAFRTMVEAGLPLSEAAALSGLMVSE